MPTLSAKYPILIVEGIFCSICFSACTGQISTKSISSSSVHLGTASSGERPTQQELSQATYAMEAAISDGCLKAWRTAIAGNYQGALVELDTLQHKYPKSPTVSFMKGQVLELSGDKKGAVKYYREGIRDNEFGSIHRFKLAEALRTTGDIEGAEREYRHLIETSPEFIDGRLGLAKVLLKRDPLSTEASRQLTEVLKLEPENKEALAMLKKADKSPQR